MNRELTTAGVLKRWRETVEAMFASHVGYVEDIATVRVRGVERAPAAARSDRAGDQVVAVVSLPGP